MPKYRKLPVEIEAIQWTGNNLDEYEENKDIWDRFIRIAKMGELNVEIRN